MVEEGKVAIIGCGKQAVKHIGGLRSDPRPPRAAHRATAHR